MADRSDNSERSDFNRLESDCTPPPDHPLPADQLGRYSPERDFFAEKDIADYLRTQARGETVQNVERIKTEYVTGAPYEIWDVTTDKDRWWVITNPTNLYSQRHFPSLDYTLSFHLGLMMRLRSRSLKEAETGTTPFDEVMRRHAQAVEQLEKAVEAVEFQAVGMQLRECLISLMMAARRRVTIEAECDHPKDADVIGWNRVILGQLLPGDGNDELRSYVKAVVEKAWPLVSWLTHHRNATKTAALVAWDSVELIIRHYVQLLGRERADRTEQCPQCASRNLRSWYDMHIAPNGAYFDECQKCSWTNHPGAIWPEADFDDEGSEGSFGS